MKKFWLDLTTDERYRVERAARHELPAELPPHWKTTKRGPNGRALDYDPPGRGLGSVRVFVEVEMIDSKLWLHVSMSRPNRLPSWDDVRDVKDAIVGKERKAIQVLPPEAEYVNIAVHCLNLYAPLEGDPLPDFRGTDASGRFGI